MWLRYVSNQFGLCLLGHRLLHEGIETDRKVYLVPCLPLRASLHWVDSLREHYHIQRGCKGVQRFLFAKVRQIHLSLANHKLLRSRNPLLCRLHACLHRRQQSQEEKAKSWRR